MFRSCLCLVAHNDGPAEEVCNSVSSVLVFVFHEFREICTGQLDLVCDIDIHINALATATAAIRPMNLILRARVEKQHYIIVTQLPAL